MQCRDVGIRFQNVTRLHREQVLDGFLAKRLFESFYDFFKPYRGMAPDVVYTIGGVTGRGVRFFRRPIRVGSCRAIQHAYDALDDIVDISEIASVLSEVKNIDGLAREDVTREEKKRHIGPSPRTIHGKKAQSCR